MHAHDHGTPPEPGSLHGGHHGGDHGGHHGGHHDHLPTDDGIPSMLQMLFSWHPEAYALIFIGLLAVGYAAGVLALRRRGDHWSWGRTAWWYVGLLSLLLVTVNGFGPYGMTLFSAHMVQHMVVGMLSPILLLVGAPVTLALRALPAHAGGRGAPRRWLLWLLHSRYGRVLSHPVVTVGMFVASLYVLYFTPLLDIAMASHLGHMLMLLHFLAVGFVFFGPILAIDPWPRQSSPGLRLVELLSAVPFHSFFGIAVMSATSPLSTHYTETSQMLGVDPVRDQYLGGGIAWGFGEIPIVVVLLIVFIQWVRDDQRAARRQDRKASRDGDADLAAYNAQLRRLADAETAQRSAQPR